jgi:hypothetical protein
MPYARIFLSNLARISSQAIIARVRYNPLIP